MSGLADAKDESVDTLKRRLKKAISVAEKLKSKYDFETEVSTPEKILNSRPHSNRP